MSESAENGSERQLELLARRLQAERPVPRPAFRGELRRRLIGELERRPAQVGRVRLLITAYAGSGAALLAIAVIGLAGFGPLAA